MKRYALLLFLMIGSFWTTSCTTQKTEISVPKLVGISNEVEPFFTRQNITIITDETREIDAVVQYDGKVLNTFFLDPSGRPVVILEQRERLGKVTGRYVDKIPFDLRWVMQVIGATLVFTPLQGAFEGRKIHQSEIGPIEDVWKKGKIRTRHIVKNDTMIHYEWKGERCPATISIVDAKRHYRFLIQTTQCGEEL